MTTDQQSKDDLFLILRYWLLAVSAYLAICGGKLWLAPGHKAAC